MHVKFTTCDVQWKNFAISSQVFLVVQKWPAARDRLDQDFHILN
jgi:hypothetical protein